MRLKYVKLALCQFSQSKWINSGSKFLSFRCCCYSYTAVPLWATVNWKMFSCSWSSSSSPHAVQCWNCLKWHLFLYYSSHSLPSSCFWYSPLSRYPLFESHVEMIMAHWNCESPVHSFQFAMCTITSSTSLQYSTFIPNTLWFLLLCLMRLWFLLFYFDAHSLTVLYFDKFDWWWFSEASRLSFFTFERVACFYAITVGIGAISYHILLSFDFAIFLSVWFWNRIRELCFTSGCGYCTFGGDFLFGFENNLSSEFWHFCSNLLTYDLWMALMTFPSHVSMDS